MNSEQVTRLLFETYHERLVSSLEEADVFDKRGNLLLTPGLKVRDKKSGYEYTVARVQGTGDDATVVLNAPDAPRMEPAPTGPEIIHSDLEADAYIPSPEDAPSEPLSVSAKDFKKNFIVESR